MTGLPSVRRGPDGLIAEHAGRRWVLPSVPPAAAVAELSRLDRLMTAAPDGMAALIDYRAIAGPAGADWERLDEVAAALLVRFTAETWGLSCR